MKRPLIGFDQWPEAMLPVVMRHGPEKTYKIGLEVLGFPPNWSFPTGEEILKLNYALTQQEKNHE